MRWVFTIALIAVILWKVPLAETLQQLQSTSIPYLLLAILIFGISFALAGVRWHVLLTEVGVHHPVSHTIALRFIALFYNNFAPSTLGGDVAKTYIVVKGHSAETPEVAASVIVDRITGVVAMVIVGLVTAFYTPLPGLRAVLAGLLVACALIVFIVWLLSRVPEKRLEAARASKNTLMQFCCRALAGMTKFVKAIDAYRHKKAALIWATVWSCAMVITSGISMRYWALALNFDLPMSQAIGISVIVMIAQMVPVSINGIGWLEGTKILLLTMAGMGQPEALGLALLQRVCTLALSLLGGLLQLPATRKSSSGE